MIKRHFIIFFSDIKKKIVKYDKKTHQCSKSRQSEDMGIFMKLQKYDVIPTR